MLQNKYALKQNVFCLHVSEIIFGISEEYPFEFKFKQLSAIKLINQLDHQLNLHYLCGIPSNIKNIK